MRRPCSPVPAELPESTGWGGFPPHGCPLSSGELATCEQIGAILLAWHNPAARLNISNIVPARLERRPPARGQCNQKAQLAQASVITCLHEPEPISRNLRKYHYNNMKIFNYYLQLKASSTVFKTFKGGIVANSQFYSVPHSGSWS